MLYRVILILLFSVSVVGCNKAYEQASRFHDDGKAKPSVALVPVFNSSEAAVGWDLSEEFTDHLRQRFLKKNQFYLATSEEVSERTMKLSQEHNPFTNHYDWVKEAFSGQEFVIFVELMEHDIHLKKPKENLLDKISPSSEISISMRVRVFDLRGEKPAVILQEIVHQDHLIPQPADLTKQDAEKWKKLTFSFSPLGLAHSQIAKEVSTRIEDYILVAHSK